MEILFIFHYQFLKIILYNLYCRRNIYLLIFIVDGIYTYQQLTDIIIPPTLPVINLFQYVFWYFLLFFCYKI